MYAEEGSRSRGLCHTFFPVRPESDSAHLLALLPLLLRPLPQAERQRLLAAAAAEQREKEAQARTAADLERELQATVVAYRADRIAQKGSCKYAKTTKDIEKCCASKWLFPTRPTKQDDLWNGVWDKQMKVADTMGGMDYAWYYTCATYGRVRTAQMGSGEANCKVNSPPVTSNHS